MKVILVDPLVVCYSKLRSDRDSFTGYVPIEVPESAFQPPPSAWKSDNDLNFKIFKDVGLLTFQIEKKEENVTVLLFSDTKIEDNCVLGRIWDRFQDKAKISMVIQIRGNDQVLQDFALFEDMLIENKRDGCVAAGRSTTNLASLELTNGGFDFKITVDIPDELFEKWPEDEISFSRKMLETGPGSYSDVTIVAGNGAEIKAHKCLLSSCSSVITAMFQNDMRESQTGRVEMIDMTEQGIRAFLQFVYCGDLQMAKEDPEIAFELLQASHKYDVSSLESKMVKCLTDIKNEDLSLGLVFRVYMFARNIGFESGVKLKRKCIQIFNLKPDELDSLQEYKDVFRKTPDVAMEVARDFLTIVCRSKVL